MRRALIGSAVAALLVVGALPVWAAGPTQVQAPLEGSTVSSGTPVRVRVPERCSALEDDRAGSVDVRLTADGHETYPGSQVVGLTRTKACESGSEYSEWGGVSIDPARPSPFLSGSTPMCNGRWRLQARNDRGAWGTGVSFQVSRPPAQPAGVAVSVEGEDVRVSWTRNPESDLAGYRVERRRSGSDSWSAVTTVAAATTSVVDTGVSGGTWEYRVVALRGDGRGAAPCSDADPDLSTASANRTATIAEPEPSPSPSSSPGASPSPGGSPSPGDGGGTSGGDGTDGGATDGGTGSTGDDTSGGSTDGDGATDGGSGDGGSTGGGSTSGGGSTRRVGAPPSVSNSGPQLGDAELPAVAAPPSPEERYYGEGDEYSTEIDFGSVDSVDATETGTRTRTRVQTRMVPQALQEFVSRYVDPDRVLKPVAAGLVLVAFALHLRRWTREDDALRH